MNLVQVSFWFRGTSSGWLPMEQERVNPDGSVKSLNGEEWAYLPLMPPAAVPGGSVIRCTWEGIGRLTADGGGITSLARTPNSIDFRYEVTYPNPPGAWLILNELNPANPLRAVDCREVNAPKNQMFTDDFLAFASQFGVLRFLDWQFTNLNRPIQWSQRQPGNAFVMQPNDGIAIERMVELANQANADPWFLMPWNADEEYVTKFAQYVHDNLRPDRKVYVELSNEVWNGGFEVWKQAEQEARTLGLGSGTDGAARRYAQKSAWALKIWTQVFADRPSSLVRVVTTQNGSNQGELILNFGDTGQYVDALSTAPYFGWDISGVPDGSPPEAYLDVMGQRMGADIERAKFVKGIADRYGKRYITYEGGQHLMHWNVDFLGPIQRHPRMYDLYLRYLTELHDMSGDLVTLYNSTHPISQYGSWGLREYQGQSVSQAPKLRAAQEFAAAH